MRFEGWRLCRDFLGVGLLMVDRFLSASWNDTVDRRMRMDESWMAGTLPRYGAAELVSLRAAGEAVWLSQEERERTGFWM